ncbi:glycosyltransferase family 4 protein [Rickettsia endosymbiont of Halotydeus destructor]|uniref:glycosyltransferase family 4 protein n=1 Tax=Rickettsia endosymbiont of Halotydeus destructor TaxID=2996754 RepID=UPI003BAF4E70
MRVMNVMLARGDGGVEQASADYVLMLLNQGCKVSCVYVQKAKSKQLLYPYLKYIEFHQIKRFGSRDILAIFKVRKIIKDFKPDIVIAHANHAAFIAGIAAIKLVTTIGVSHGYSVKGTKYTDYVICITNHMKSILQTKISKPIFVIPNITPIFKPITDNFTFRSPPVIGALGRFGFEKNFSLLLQAVKILKNKNIIVKVIIGGDGPESNNLQQEAELLGIHDHLQWLGWVTDKDSFFSSIDIFCLTSNDEPFGIVLLEAMINCKAIISTNTYGAQEVLSHNNDSLIIPINNPEKLAEAIICFINNPEFAKQCIKQAYNKVKDHYTPEIVGKDLHRVIKLCTA